MIARPVQPGGRPVRVSRRSFLALAGVPLVGSVLVGCGMSTSTVSEPDTFDTPLPIPPLAEPEVDPDGTLVFNLTAAAGEHVFTGDVAAPTWGFNGDVLGPTIRARDGQYVAIDVENDLDEATSVHWHGMHLPAEMDGGPHQMIEPGGSWRAHWQIRQAGSTLWYHPHPHGATEQHVYQGLAGLFLIDDDETEAAGLPGTYGVDDIPLIVQDKSFDDDGHLTIDDGGNEIGLLGDVVVVNGVAGAVLEVTTERVRLRILNGSTARTYSFGFADHTFELVATDGGLLREPVELDQIRLSPGERAEIVVAMEPGTETMLHSFEPDLGGVVAGFAYGANDSFDVLRLVAAESLSDSEPVPAVLSAFALDPEQASVRRTFELSERSINGVEMDMARIDETVVVDTIEMWEVTNQDRSPHNFHVHDVQFEVVSIDGEAPPAELSGRKDTVYLEPGVRYEFVMMFTDYTDPQLPYMYHCHLLRHEDEGMMGQFVVVAAGEEADASALADHDHTSHGRTDHDDDGHDHA